METKIIVLALAFVLLFGMAVVQAYSDYDWEDDWDSSDYDYGYSCCGPSFLILALGLGLVSQKHF
ncbi:MAG: hypothetical protein QXL47_02225 [Candidatus Anstonellales archaeon]